MTPRLFVPALATLPALNQLDWPSPSQPQSADATLAPLPLPPSIGPIQLDESSAHHLLRVLRRREGDAVALFDGQGRAYQAELASTKLATVRLLSALPPEALPPVRLGLAQCLSTADKMDWTIEKAVELGVSMIVPLLSARSLVKLDASRADKRLAHWERLVVAAAMQSQRNHLPMMAPVQPLKTWLGSLGAPSTDEKRWVLHPAGHASLARQSLDAPDTRTAWLLCGPESGLSAEELTLAIEAGWLPAGLGPRVLRTETAGLVGLSVLQTTLGDLG
ncbi:MAG: 16S rRNA (uracil(1498)-N(3))-methyltransferase [Lautropia sp.]|nr:16S rRNA (uracil(1498)-N(3))-methyltransferase [Lautropia sp.]